MLSRLSLFVLGVLAVGCAGRAADAPGDQAAGPIATVHCIEAPNRMAPSDTLSVRLRGTVGPNGCYSFDRMSVERAPERIEITPLVDRVHRGNGACTMAIVPLDETLHLEPPFAGGTLSVVVPQSDGPAVTTTVSIVPE